MNWIMVIGLLFSMCGMWLLLYVCPIWPTRINNYVPVLQPKPVSHPIHEPSWREVLMAVWIGIGTYLCTKWPFLAWFILGAFAIVACWVVFGNEISWRIHYYIRVWWPRYKAERAMIRKLRAEGFSGMWRGKRL